MTLVVDPVVGVISLLIDPFAPSSLLLVPAFSAYWGGVVHGERNDE